MMPLATSKIISLDQFLAVPLTYDDFLSDDLTQLVSSTPGSYITDMGMRCNGVDSRLLLDPVPTWAASGNLFLQATITPFLPTRNSTLLRDVVVSVGNSGPRLQLSVLKDPVNPAWLCVGFRGRNSSSVDVSVPYVRRDWRFEGRYPQLSSGGNYARPQSICFNAADDGYVCLAHYQDADSIFHIVDASGDLIGQYAAGVASHYSTLARDQSGRLWTLDYSSGTLRRINESVSLSSGTLTTDFSYSLGVIAGAGAIEFITYSGTDYILVAQFLTSGTPYLYAIAVSTLTSGGTFALASRYKRFVIQFTCQGLAVSSFGASKLYISSNRIGSEPEYGRLYTVSISSLMAGADGASAVIVDLYQAPSKHPEDLDFDSNGRLWTLTEGQASVGDVNGFLALWSSALVPQANTHSVFYSGAAIEYKINGLDFQSFSFVSGLSGALALAIGGPSFGAGWSAGYFAGLVRDVYISPVAATADRYEKITTGYFEPKLLTVVPLTIVNPGAESGVSGWVNQVGSISTRSADPAPYQGSAYFFGGPNVQTISYQNVNFLTPSGLDQSTINGLGHWVNLVWQQAAFAGDTDKAGMGLAAMDGASELSRTYSEIFNVGAQEWFIRSFSKNMDVDADIVKIIYRTDRLNGTNNDGYIDSISAALYIQND
jgi:hypothetical protein